MQLNVIKDRELEKNGLLDKIQAGELRAEEAAREEQRRI